MTLTQVGIFLNFTAMETRQLLRILLFSPSLFFNLTALSQTPDASSVAPDSALVKTSFINRLKKAGQDEAQRSIEKYKSGRVKIEREQTLEDLKQATRELKIIIERGFDTGSVSKELDQSKANLEIVKDGVFTNTGTLQTQRNLAVSSVILNELLAGMNSHQAALNNYTRTLIGFRDKIDSINSISALYAVPVDSVETMRYYKKLVVIVKEIGPPDSALNLALGSVEDLQTRVDEHVFDLKTHIERVEKFSDGLTKKILTKEVPGIMDPPAYHRPLGQILQVSFAKEKMALGFYIRGNKARIFLLLLLIAATTFFLYQYKNKAHQLFTEPSYSDLVLLSPFLSAVIIIISLFQFLFLDPPFIFSYTLWLSEVICLSIIFKGLLSNYWIRFWLIIVILFLLAGANNMILQASRTERWYMLLFSLVGAGYGSYVLLRGHRHDLKEKRILYFIGFMVVFEIAATIANLTGRFNLSKTLLVSGFIGVVIAILFLWTVRLINQALSITSKVYKHPDKKLFYFNFDKLGEKVPAIFYVFLVLGWLVLVGKNFYIFQKLSRAFNTLLDTEHTLGSYSFSVNGLFVFFIILTVSVLLSRIISFFATDPDVSHTSEEERKRVGLGSWILLVRIFIISMGLFLAFAASGFPLDKITIILGALGVGIGLGLQGLVNNLVSGLIIAFEKPVKVGDTIELYGKPGTMKSIGFRSSVVILSDGASLIIPNGDLLSQHLVNWSMGKSIKRISIVFGVAYGTDLEKVRDLVKDVVNIENRILRQPAAVVVPLGFNKGVIDFEILFWINQKSDAMGIRGNVIRGIDQSFREAGIVIPVPQQDVYLHNVPSEK
jgi:small-conductance mechanosensitive channel